MSRQDTIAEAILAKLEALHRANPQAGGKVPDWFAEVAPLLAEAVDTRLREHEGFPGREYRVASSLGNGYMIPQYYGGDRDAAATYLRRHNRQLAGLPGVDTVRIESRPPAGEWLPEDTP